MIEERESNTRRSTNGWAAAQHADYLSNLYRPTFSQAKRDQAFRAKTLIEMEYPTTVHLNYRKTKISIKVEAPARPYNQAALDNLESILAVGGVTKKHTPQGVIYHIAK